MQCNLDANFSGEIVTSSAVLDHAPGSNYMCFYQIKSANSAFFHFYSVLNLRDSAEIEMATVSININYYYILGYRNRLATSPVL